LVGDLVGARVGGRVGIRVGSLFGVLDGAWLGLANGLVLGIKVVGLEVVGIKLGLAEGILLGMREGFLLGVAESFLLGAEDGFGTGRGGRVKVGLGIVGKVAVVGPIGTGGPVKVGPVAAVGPCGVGLDGVVIGAAATFQFLAAVSNWNMLASSFVSAMMTRFQMPDVSLTCEAKITLVRAIIYLKSTWIAGSRMKRRRTHLQLDHAHAFFFDLKEQYTLHSYGCTKVIANEKADCWIIAPACCSIRIKSIEGCVHWITAPKSRKKGRVCRRGKLG
jgi:hypothetical protein